MAAVHLVQDTTQKYYLEAIDLALFLNRHSPFKEPEYGEPQLRGHGQFV